MSFKTQQFKSWLGNFVHIYTHLVLFFFFSSNVCVFCLNIRNGSYWKVKIKLTNEKNTTTKSFFLSKVSLFSLSTCKPHVHITAQFFIMKYCPSLYHKILSLSFFLFLIFLFFFASDGVLKHCTEDINLIGRCPLV